MVGAACADHNSDGAGQEDINIIFGDLSKNFQILGQTFEAFCQSLVNIEVVIEFSKYKLNHEGVSEKNHSNFFLL